MLIIRKAIHIFRQASARDRSRRGRASILMATLVLLCTIGTAQTWRTEVVDDGNGHDVGYFSSLAIDRQGGLHIAYFDSTANELFYAFRSTADKQWSRMEVDKDGLYVTLAVDSAGRPHFAYNSTNLTGLHYAHWNGATWDKAIVDSDKTSYNTSIQVDAQDHPKISYYVSEYTDDEHATQLKYAYFDGKAWYIQTLDHRPRTGKMNWLALDRQGNPHIAYSFFYGVKDLYYVWWDGNQWQRRAPDTPGNTAYLGLGASDALDSLGHPHIAYLDATKRILKYISQEGTRWIPEIVDNLAGVDVHDHVSLQIDNQDRPQIAYYDGGVLKYAVKETDGWHKEIVDHTGNVGFRPSLYLDAHGQPYISYYDVSNRTLHLAYRSSGVATAALKK